jgi:hypothetical protein
VHAPASVTNNGADGIYLALGGKLFVGALAALEGFQLQAMRDQA